LLFPFRRHEVESLIISLPLLLVIRQFKKSPTAEWKSIIHRYLGNSWVKNEIGALKTMAKQRKKLPISVEQARAQVIRLKEQSLSNRKERVEFSGQVGSLEEATLFLF